MKMVRRVNGRYSVYTIKINKNTRDFSDSVACSKALLAARHRHRNHIDLVDGSARAGTRITRRLGWLVRITLLAVVLGCCGRWRWRVCLPLGESGLFCDQAGHDEFRRGDWALIVLLVWDNGAGDYAKFKNEEL